MSDLPTIENVPEAVKGSLIEWLREKLTAAKKEVRARKQMQETFCIGSDADWEAAANNHGGTVMKKDERLNEAAKQRRIATKCQRDVDMFELILSAVER